MNYNNLIINMNAFYSYIGKIEDLDFSKVSNEKIEEIYNQSIKLNQYFTIYKYSLKSFKYIKIIEWIKTTPRRYNISSKEEQLLLIMFAIDPTLECLLIFETNNKFEDIKKQIQNKCGLFDKNLIKVEKEYVKNFYSKEQKEELEEKIMSLAYK